MRNHRAIIPTFSVALLAGWIALAAAPPANRSEEASASLSALLEKAIFTEETLGDLDAAIGIYQEILARGEAERSYVAQAQFRLGMCYLKKGRKDEAVAALQKLVEDFPKQQELVAQARDRLTELGYPPTDRSGIVVRKVWEGGSEYALYGSPSPDGRFLSLRDQGELSILDLGSGKTRQLTINDGPGWGPWGSVVSPDGRQIAYAWWEYEGTGLRVIGLDGSEARVLSADQRTDLRPVAWFPEGKHVLARWMDEDRTTVIAVVGIEDGSVRVLKTLERASPGGMSLSPDGRYLAYDLPSSQDKSERDLYLLATRDGRETRLVTDPGSDAGPIWAPDGRGLVFLSDRGGSIGAWWMPVVDGAPTGSPVVLKPDTGRIVPLGIDRHGSYYYGALKPARNVFTVTLDLTTGKAAGPPEIAIDEFVGRNVGPEWSPDGSRLAYFSERALTADWLDTVVVRDIATGDERVFNPNLARVGESYRPAWSPDGRYVVVTGADRNGHQGFYGIDARTGETTPIVQASFGDFLENITWSADGKTVFYDHDESETHPSLAVARDLETGHEKVLARAAHPVSVSVMGLSPDGRQLVLRYRDSEEGWTSLSLIPVEGGEPRELLRLQPPQLINGSGNLVWTPDGRELIFVVADTSEGGSDEIWRVAVAGGEPRQLGVAMRDIWHLSLHPDGKRLAFGAGENRAEIWVIDNILSELVASQ